MRPNHLFLVKTIIKVQQNLGELRNRKIWIIFFFTFPSKEDGYQQIQTRALNGLPRVFLVLLWNVR